MSDNDNDPTGREPPAPRRMVPIVGEVGADDVVRFYDPAFAAQLSAAAARLRRPKLHLVETSGGRSES